MKRKLLGVPVAVVIGVVLMVSAVVAASLVLSNIVTINVETRPVPVVYSVVLDTPTGESGKYYSDTAYTFSGVLSFTGDGGNVALQTINIINADTSAVLATTTTNGAGAFSTNIQLTTGTYNIRATFQP